jgi:exopolysaccharide production protein ExoQ
LSTGIAKLSDTLTKVFVVLVLLLLTEGLYPVLLYPPEGEVDPVEGDPVMQVVWLGIYGVTLLLILPRWKQFLHVAAGDKLLLLLVFIAVVSILWSAAPEVTLRRLVSLMGGTLFAIYVATRYDLGYILRLLAWTLGIAALLSLVFALALPSLGTAQYGPDAGIAWKGIYGQKNVLGRTMVLSAVIFLLLALSSRRYRWVAWAFFGLSVSLLLLSSSITAMVSLLVVLILVPLYATLRRNYMLAVPLFIVTLLVGGIASAVFIDNFESILLSLGKETTLTGRTDIWPAVLEMIWQRPWLGYGYGGFWLGWSGESATVWLRNAPIGLEAPHAHNGFFDLWLELGLLGLSVFALGFVLALSRAIAWMRLTRTAEGLFPIAFLTFVLVYNIAESSLVRHQEILWVLYIVVSLSTVVRRVQLTRTNTVGGNSRKMAQPRVVRSRS